VTLERKAHGEFKAPKAIRATKGQLEIVAQQVRKVFKDLRVIKVILVLLVHVVHKAPKVIPALPVRLGQAMLIR
jgi:hypothetical protein